jgi:Domain of unknown function (DUF1996)
MKPTRVLLSLLLLSAPSLLSGRGAEAAQSNGQFVLRCTYSHTLPDDPIVFPGQPGASHVHDFFGNIGVNAFSTMESMLADETTCRVPSDTAGYWAPQASLNGVPITPTVMRIYYLGPRNGTVETIPPGLQMVGGEPHATSPAENPHVSWNCGQTKAVKTPQAGLPYDCTPWAHHGFVDGIVASIDFPSCWNGTGLTPDDVAYPVQGSCPPGFPRVIPRLSERVHFGVMNPLNPDGSLAFTLSSGPAYTLHADFWNTWQQERLDQLVADCLIARVHCGSVDSTSTIEWSEQFGTRRYDLAYAAAPDGDGGSYVTGFTNFALDGQQYHHRYDAFLRRYDADGNELWTRQFGTNGVDQALAIAVVDSDVYVAGSTTGRFPKQELKGGLDAFVASFDADGTQRWLEQFGTPKDDAAAAISASGAGVFTAGTTNGKLGGKRRGASDAFVARFDPDGERVWTQQFGGVGDDGGLAVAVRGGVVNVGGSTRGFAGAPADLEGFVASYDVFGSRGEFRLMGGAGDDAVTAVAVSGGGLFFAGWTSGAFLNQPAHGGLDAVVGSLHDDLSVEWVNEFGSPADDDAASIAAVDRGIYVAGSTLGSLPEGGLLGETDGFLLKFLPKTGTEVWTRQLGTDDYDRVYGMAADPKGVVVVGTTHGVVAGDANAGDRDVFAIRVAFS